MTYLCIFPDTCPARASSRWGLLDHLYVEHRMSGFVMSLTTWTLTDRNGNTYPLTAVEEAA